MKFLCLFPFFVTISAQIFELNVNDKQIQLDPSETQNFKTTDEHSEDRTHKLNFEKPYYIINDENTKLTGRNKPLFDLQMNRELVKGDFKLTDVQKFGMEQYFSVSSVDNIKVSVDVKSDIPEENLKDKNQLMFLLEFIPENKDDTIHTMLIMSLPEAADSNGSGGSSWFILTSILSAILALALIATILYLVHLRRANSPAIRRKRRSNNRSPATVLEDDLELQSQTRYIGAEENVRVISRFDQLNRNAFLNPSFQSTQSMVYSDSRDTEEVVIMQNNSQLNMNDSSTAGVSSFKPSSSDTIFPLYNLTDHRNLNRDLDFSISGNAASSSGMSNIPGSDLISPPSVPEQLSKRTNTDGTSSSKL